MLRCTLAAALLVVVIASCSGSDAPVRVEPLELRVPIPRDILTLDPADPDAEETVTRNVVRQLYEGLVEHDPGTLEVVPRLAASWNVSDDGLRWTFNMREGVRFADDPCFPSGRGRELRSDDVKASIERGIARAAGELGGGFLPDIAGISTPTPLTLEIALRKPSPTLLHLLARPPCFVVAPEAVSRYGEALRVHPVGTGPFRLVSWNRNGVFIVRRRDYWGVDDDGRRLPYLDAVRFVLPVPYFSEYALYLRGKLDHFVSWFLGPSGRPIPGEEWAGESERAAHYFVPWWNVIYFRFDMRSLHPLVRDPDMRRALSFAAPRQVPEIHQAAGGLLPPGLPGYDPGLARQSSDLDRARSLLHAAGYPDGRGLPPLRVIAQDWDPGSLSRLTARLAEVGIEVSGRVLNAESYREAIVAGDADLFREGWMARYPDPQDFLQLFYSGFPQNAGFYANAEYDRLFVTLRDETAVEVRMQLTAQLERILIEDHAALFLRHERQSQYVSPRVIGWEPNCTNPLNTHYFERLRLRPSGETER